MPKCTPQTARYQVESDEYGGNRERFRGVCAAHGWFGPVRKNVALANQDKAAHQKESTNEPFALDA